MSGFSICSRRRRRDPPIESEEHRRVRHRVGSEIQLNVGGVRYDTTKQTLAQCDYFGALFDDDSNFAPVSCDVFVDRNGELFQHILEYMRTAQRPAKEVLLRHRQQLLAEADFFGFESFRRELQGSTNPYKLRPEDKRIWLDEQECAACFAQDLLSDADISHWENHLLKDVFYERVQDTLVTEDPAHLMLPVLWPCQDGQPSAGAPIGAGRSVKVDSADAFREAFENFTGGLLQDLGVEAASGLVFAGGSVLHGLCGTPASDIDIFLIGADEEAAEQKLWRILAAVKRNALRLARAVGPERERETRLEILKLTRTKMCVTAFRPLKPDRAFGTFGTKLPAVQIVLSTYRSPLEVITSFDIDACCVLYDPGQHRVFALPRCLRALRFRANIADTRFRSPTFERRIEKYARRGFAIAVPGLDEGAIRPELFTGKYYFQQECKLLLRLCKQRSAVGELHEIHPEGIWPQAKLFAGKHCQSEVVEGLERLVVLDLIGRKVVDGDSAADALRDAVLVRGDESTSDEVVTICSDLQYRRYMPDGTEEDLADSDAECALWVVNNLIEKHNFRVDLDAEQRMLAQHEHHLQNEMPRTVDVLTAVAWKQWAKERRERRKRVWIVSQGTRVDNVEHTDLTYFRDIGMLTQFHTDTMLEDAAFQHHVGVPRRIKFTPPRLSGHSGHGSYNRKDWFAGVYG